MKNFILTFLFFSLVITTSNAQITSITPNQGCPGQPLQTTITSNGLFLQSSSPSGNIYSIKLKQTGFASMTLFEYDFSSSYGNATISNANTVALDFIINSSTLGLYDLEVIIGDVLYPFLNQVTYTLPAAFTVVPPDGTISGTVYHDLNDNGIKDGGEPAVPNRTVKLLSWGTTSTDVNGDYDFAVANGNYSVCVLPGNLPYMFVSTVPDTAQVTINNNNATAIDFGLKHTLTSVIPNVGLIGIPTTHQITADLPIFQPGINPNGNVSYIQILTLPNTTFISSAFVTVIDSFTIQFETTIPIGSIVSSNLDIRVTTFGTYNGTHFLTGQFGVLVAPYTISGSKFFDTNQNKIKDPGEPGINNSKLELAPSNSIAFTDVAGDFTIASLGGTQTLTPDLTVTGLVLFTDSASYTMNVTSSMTGKDFGYISTSPDYSIITKDIYVFARCNTDQNVSFKVRNNSNIAYDAKVWLKYDDALLNYVSAITTPPTSISNDTLYWDITNFQPYSELELKALFGLPGAGTNVEIYAGASSFDGGGAQQLNYTTFKNHNVFCAWDPNDKQVNPPGILAQNYTLMTDTLEYLIRFQNTGSDTAFNVVVLDTLNSNLNFNTFEILESSHSLQTELKNDGSITFTFANILLVDSIANEPESHGYIRYRILANTGLVDETVITNTAHIFFDFNPAVVTNTTLNTMVYVLPTSISEINENDGVFVYPNPFSQSTTIQFENPGASKYTLVIYDIAGKVVLPEVNTNGNKFIVEKNKLSVGMYFFKLTDANTSAVRTGKLLIE